MGDGHGVERQQALWGTLTLVDKHGIDAFQVRKHDQLLECGCITHIAGLLGVGITPLFGCDAKQCHIQ